MSSEIDEELPLRLAPDGSTPDTSAVTPPRPIETLGLRLDRAGRRIAARRMPPLPWLRAFQKVLERVTTLPNPDDLRFARRESSLTTTLVPPSPMWQAIVKDSNPELVTTSAVANRPGSPLASDLRMRLQEIVGPGVQAMRVHDDADADKFARAQGADAVATGPDVFFQKGKFQPADRKGFGLLVHEATHVVEAMAPGAAWRRATVAGQRDEERLAATRELGVVRSPHSLSSPVAAIGPFSPPAAITRPTVAASAESAVYTRPGEVGWPSAFGHQVQFPPDEVHTRPGVVGWPSAAPGILASAADSSPVRRPMAASSDRTTENAPAQQPFDLAGLREGLFRDLMRRIKSDFERGA